MSESGPSTPRRPHAQHFGPSDHETSQREQWYVGAGGLRSTAPPGRLKFTALLGGEPVGKRAAVVVGDDKVDTIGVRFDTECGAVSRLGHHTIAGRPDDLRPVVGEEN